MTTEEEKDLHAGVERLLQAGATKEQIKGLLLARGWSSDEIEIVFGSLIFSEDYEQPAAAEKTTEDPVFETTSERRVATPGKISNPLALLKESFFLLFSNLGKLFTLSLIGVLPLSIFAVIYIVLFISGGEKAILQKVMDYSALTWMTLPLIAVGGLVLFLLIGWLLNLTPATVLLLFGRDKPSIGQALSKGSKRAYPLFWSFLLLTIFFVSGLAFLLIPGLIFLFWFSFAPAVVTYTNSSPFKALLISRELLRNRAWSVLTHFLTFFLLSIVFVIASAGILSPLSDLDSLSVGTGIALVVMSAVVISLFLVFFFFLISAHYALLYRELEREVEPSKGLATFLSRFLISVMVLLSLGVGILYFIKV